MIELHILSFDNKSIGICTLDALNSLLSHVFQCTIHAVLLPKEQNTDYNLIDCLTDNDRFFLKAQL